VRTINLPEVKARLADASIAAQPTSPEEFAAFIKSEVDKWSRVVRDANVPKQ